MAKTLAVLALLVLLRAPQETSGIHERLGCVSTCWCEEQHLQQAVFAPVVALSPLHPAHVILNNLVIGACNVEQYSADKAERERLIANSRTLVRLMGGEPVSSTARPQGSNLQESSTNASIQAHDENNGDFSCSANTSEHTTDCARRYASNFFDALADNASIGDIDPVSIVACTGPGTYYCSELSNDGEACGYLHTMGHNCSGCHNCPEGFIMGTGHIGQNGTCAATVGDAKEVWEQCGLPPPPQTGGSTPAGASRFWLDSMEISNASALNATVHELAVEYCRSHDMLSSLPDLQDTLSAIKQVEGDLLAVGCPCDISDIFPAGGVEEGGFNITLTVTGLDTRRFTGKDLACVFNAAVEVTAEVLSSNMLRCTVPASLSVLANATNQVVSNAPAGVASGWTGAGSTQVRIVDVDVQGDTFRITRSLQGAKKMMYFSMPTFDLNRTTPLAFVTGTTPVALRTITVYGTHFTSRAGGMLLRLVNASSSLIIGRANMTVLDATRATAVMPDDLTRGVYRLELSLNADVWCVDCALACVREQA